VTAKRPSATKKGACGSRLGLCAFHFQELQRLGKLQGKDWGATACDWCDARLWAVSKGLRSALALGRLYPQLLVETSTLTPRELIRSILKRLFGQDTSEELAMQQRKYFHATSVRNNQ
jgi:hypothetical protein